MSLFSKFANDGNSNKEDEETLLIFEKQKIQPNLKIKDTNITSPIFIQKRVQFRPEHLSETSHLQQYQEQMYEAYHQTNLERLEGIERENMIAQCIGGDKMT